MARRLLALAWVAASLALAAAGQVAAAGMETTVNVTSDGIAIGGWDTVAYFTEESAVRGMPEFSHEWDGATWLFSSAANRDLFASEPEAYAPEFGGWCAYALSQGRYAAEVEPANAWTVRDGRLYLNWNASVRERWLGSNVANGIRVGERNWELVVKDILEGDAEYSRKSDSPWNAL